MPYTYIFVGGAIGASLRYLISQLNIALTFPLGTWLVNVIGAFAMAWCSTTALSLLRHHPKLKKGLTTGLIGALTTFSTFQFELVSLFDQGNVFILIIYALTSYVGGIAACLIGLKLGGRKHA
ncbi:fluoride exporter [Staphylococcus auricularis]|uniref:Fluoride-specific ion channel FluC n=1 Tax=Staphylococcus auricularis TaxID=29379 RepID=A0AAP8PQT0_9STAP|nr:fluoride efflux transporter CrcB [Staphylococcus auricularis]MBM0868170.1 fluoride efflux transporter CrcB [Staphylococcus auricularis]MCG7341690.1 fluoride efflux transporter CrcB [Staphylococcus auricularis]MDC6326990.1 fluoride efflux transporter CrcB [Staphylococcus auricularis]MDN4532867.1 fluoride efflux transporter CrcB [Staphylococcus auricularis]PNZ69316.1 fluoride efflux transporter CrcB [Staphylococcus auricularis]